jgi:hypothetical protein
MPKMPKSVQFRPVVMGGGSTNSHNANPNLGSANYSLARIPSASLENGVQGGLPSIAPSVTEGQGQSNPVKVSQTSVGKA